MTVSPGQGSSQQPPPSQGVGGPKKHTTSLNRHGTHAYIMTFPREMRNLLAGGVAGMVAKSIVAPVDRIKILYQVSSRAFRLVDVPQIATKIIRDEGFAALWKGNTATMIRVFPYSGIQFMVFDRCKTFFLHKHSQSGVEREWGLSPMESLLSGSVAGICSAACTYPLDMTRAQLAVLKSKKHVRNVGFVGILVKNYQERVCIMCCYCCCCFVAAALLMAFDAYILVNTDIATLSTITPTHSLSSSSSSLGIRWIVPWHYTHPPWYTPLCWHCIHSQRTSKTANTKHDWSRTHNHAKNTMRRRFRSLCSNPDLPT